ncbi:MAG: hypothetical protein IIA60_08945 [Candidatus Marinimicrobia bacterium]|nr:hypothetical protein [Candidatus Neomarinimicrobiota bacterium]
MVMLITLEVAAFVVTAVLAILWIRDPSGNYEPWTVLCGAGGMAIEIFRRFRGHHESDTTPKPSAREKLIEQETVHDQISRRDALREGLGDIIPEIQAAMNFGRNVEDRQAYLAKISEYHKRLEMMRPLFEGHVDVQTALTRIGNLGGTAAAGMEMQIEFFEAFEKDVAVLKVALGELNDDLGQ